MLLYRVSAVRIAILHNIHKQYKVALFWFSWTHWWPAPTSDPINIHQHSYCQLIDHYVTSCSRKWYCLHFYKECLNCIHELLRPQSLLLWQFLTFTCHTHGTTFTCLYSSQNQWSLVMRNQTQTFEYNSSPNINDHKFSSFLILQYIWDIPSHKISDYEVWYQLEKLYSGWGNDYSFT